MATLKAALSLFPPISNHLTPQSPQVLQLCTILHAFYFYYYHYLLLYSCFLISAILISLFLYHLVCTNYFVPSLLGNSFPRSLPCDFSWAHKLSLSLFSLSAAIDPPNRVLSFVCPCYLDFSATCLLLFAPFLFLSLFLSFTLLFDLTHLSSSLTLVCSLFHFLVLLSSHHLDHQHFILIPLPLPINLPPPSSFSPTCTIPLPI